MWLRLLIQRLMAFDFLAKMDKQSLKSRWFATILILLTSFVDMEVALTPDGLALLEFKYSLTKTSPLLDNWKASDMSPCSWGGIKCTINGNVQNVTLSSQVPMLEGNISSSLGRLRYLQGLMLDYNLLSGNIPPQLGNLGSLLTLSLSNNRLSGKIPPQLGRCMNLVELWLGGNVLRGIIPESLGNLKNLSKMFIGINSPFLFVDQSVNKSDNNIFTGLLTPMIYKNLKLKEFDVSCSNLTGDITIALEELSKHPNIEWISMGVNSFTGTLPPSIKKATTLRWLSLYGQSGGGFGGHIPKEIGNLVNVENFEIALNNFIGEIPSEIGNMTSLKYLILDTNNLEGNIPSSVENLVNLVKISIYRNHLTGEIPIKELGKLPLLEIIDLSLNNLSGTISPSIGNLISLQFLSLINNSLNGTIPFSIGNLVNLRHFYISYNNITGPIPASFTSLINLQKVHFAYNALTGPFPTNISKMTTLQEVDFWGNNMWGPIPEDFGRFMPNLTIFAMNYNFFNGTLPDGLCQGGKLQRLGVGGNQLVGAIPSSLARCTSLVDVDFSDNQFTSIPDNFGSNSSLELLSVAHNQLTGNLPKGLGANSNLTHLDLSENRFTGDISILEFFKLAKSLLILNLAKNNFTGEIPATMAMCKSLFRVDLSHNFLSGVVPPTFTNLLKLETLQLQGNNLTRLDPSMYSSWATTLRTLNLAENPWNAPIATEVGSLQMLQNLNLSYGGHIGSITSELAKLKQLEVLDLSYNNLTGEVPSELGELESLILVNISFNRLTGSLPLAWMKFLHAHPDSFRGNPGLCLEYIINTNICVSKTSGRKAKLSVGIIVAMALGGAFALVTIVAFIFWWLGCATSTTKLASRSDDIIVKNLTNAPLPFTFEEIMAATENLSDAYIIGQGGHGVVYKVVSASGSASIAVKKIESLDMTTTPIHKSFWSEVETVGNAKHRNLVRLLGFMKWGKVGLLLYDYVSNGDLHSALHKKEVGRSDMIDLTWKTRLRIAEGVANGLAYLHHDYNPPIIHRDIKSSNVLLDNDLEAHISDFGLAKVLLANNIQPQSEQQWLSTPNVSGTYGYIAPEIGYGTPVTPAQDVYSFGILLLELLTGRQPIDASYGETWHIASWVKDSVLQNKGIMSDFVLDPSLLHPSNLADKEEMFSLQRIALLCTRNNPADRPTMRDVAQLLKNISSSIEIRNENAESRQ